MRFLNHAYTKYYPDNKPWVNGIFNAALVLLIFLLFQPFGFRDKDVALKLILFPVYSLLAFFYPVTSCCLVRHIFKSKNRWTVKNELLSKAVGVLPFSLLVLLLTSWFAGDMPVNLHWYFTFLYHVASLFILITLIEFLFYNNRSFGKRIHHLSSQVQLVSQQLDELKHEPDIITASVYLEIGSLSFNRNKLVLIKSIGNYLEFHFYEANGQIKKLIKRGRIQQAEKDLEGFQEFLRCHRAFVVNLNKAKRLKGNCKNARLCFDQNLEDVPVSRSRFTLLKKRLDRIIAV